MLPPSDCSPAWPRPNDDEVGRYWFGNWAIRPQTSERIMGLAVWEPGEILPVRPCGALPDLNVDETGGHSC